ncbi:hypothetical protein DB728_33210 [Rhizobium leguminosarum bv. viciae USDA 2370]|nr:hypothetical protein DB728_33210 [Rhizobium leguminosarum bv. viciae USDA 2370]
MASRFQPSQSIGAERRCLPSGLSLLLCCLPSCGTHQVENGFDDDDEILAHTLVDRPSAGAADPPACLFRPG